jgi:hypothetical protein
LPTPQTRNGKGVFVTRSTEKREEFVTEKQDAVAENLRAVATDLKSLLESATTDPKERKRKERRWRVLYSALGVITTLVARRAAAKAWAILTGEQPPTKGPAPATQPAGTEADRPEKPEEKVRQQA